MLVRGELGLQTVSTVRRAVLAAAALPISRVTVDLDRVESMDRYSVNVLLALRDQVRERSTRFVLASPSAPVRRALGAVEVWDLFEHESIWSEYPSSEFQHLALAPEVVQQHVTARALAVAARSFLIHPTSTRGIRMDDSQKNVDTNDPSAGGRDTATGTDPNAKYEQPGFEDKSLGQAVNQDMELVDELVAEEDGDLNRGGRAVREGVRRQPGPGTPGARGLIDLHSCMTLEGDG